MIDDVQFAVGNTTLGEWPLSPPVLDLVHLFTRVADGLRAYTHISVVRIHCT